MAVVPRRKTTNVSRDRTGLKTARNADFVIGSGKPAGHFHRHLPGAASSVVRF